jgi:hypothetical protein
MQIDPLPSFGSEGPSPEKKGGPSADEGAAEKQFGRQEGQKARESGELSAQQTRPAARARSGRNLLGGLGQASGEPQPDPWNQAAQHDRDGARFSRQGDLAAAMQENEASLQRSPQRPESSAMARSRGRCSKPSPPWGLNSCGTLAWLLGGQARLRPHCATMRTRSRRLKRRKAVKLADGLRETTRDAGGSAATLIP